MTTIDKNLLLLGFNHDTATWDCSAITSSQPGYPPEEMLIEGYYSQWRSEIGDTSVELVFDRGASPPTMGGVVFSGGNLRRGATVSLTCRNSLPLGEPLFASASEVAENISRFSVVPPVPQWGITFGWAFPAGIAPRYLILTVDDTGNPDDYISIATVTGSGFVQVNFDRGGHGRAPTTAGPLRAGFSPMVQDLSIRTFGATPTEAEAASVTLQAAVAGLRESNGRIGWIITGGQGHLLADRSFHAPHTGYGIVPKDLQVSSPQGAGALYASTTLTLEQATK